MCAAPARQLDAHLPGPSRLVARRRTGQMGSLPAPFPLSLSFCLTDTPGPPVGGTYSSSTLSRVRAGHEPDADPTPIPGFSGFYALYAQSNPSRKAVISPWTSLFIQTHGSRFYPSDAADLDLTDELQEPPP